MYIIANNNIALFHIHVGITGIMTYSLELSMQSFCMAMSTLAILVDWSSPP